MLALKQIPVIPVLKLKPIAGIVAILRETSEAGITVLIIRQVQTMGVIMENNKLIALFLLILALFALYLHYKQQLFPAIEILAGPNPNSKTTPLYIYAIALIVFLGVSAFIPQNYSTTLAAVIVFDAVLNDTSNGHNVIKEILNP